MATVSSTGFTARTKDEILADIYDRWAAKPDLGPDFLTNPDTPQVQIAEAFAESLAQTEEGIAAQVGQFSRSAAVGQWLDDAGERIGVPRRQPTKSTVSATVNLDDGVVLPAGSQAADSTDADEVYETIEDVSNTSGSPADVAVEMRAVTAGTATFVTAGQLTSIVTPVSGWNSVTNAADAEAGTDLETDAAYRVRMDSALAVAGAGTPDAIRAAILLLDGVTSCTVLVNDLDITDGDGLPPHSFSVVVAGGDGDEIAQAIWDNGPSGGRAYGTSTGTATDAAGATHMVEYERPTEVDIIITITLTTDGDYPGDAAFKTALVDAADSFFGLDDDVIYQRIAALALAVTGVTDVTALQIGAPSLGSSNITIDALEQAAFDTSDITVS